jgi:hypothetical protein
MDMKNAEDIWEIAGEKFGIFLSIIINFVNQNAIILFGAG